MTAEELNGLLDELQHRLVGGSRSTPAVRGVGGSFGGGVGEFIGPQVTNAIRRCKYPSAWRPLISRYVDLVGDNGDGLSWPLPPGVRPDRPPAEPAALHVYCDMVCTVITKKIMMVDVFYLYEPAWDENEDEKRLREVHTLTATKYLVKMLNCVYECVHGRLPDVLDVTEAASMLYADVYAEAFDPATVDEKDVFGLVEHWFRVRVLKHGAGRSFTNVAPGIPFLLCSHVYWLWLHLTAARVRHSAPDLVTVVYALDTIIYCGDCRHHFVEHRTEYFSDGRTRRGDSFGLCTSRLGNAELLFHLHNRVNVQTGSPVMDESVLAEYLTFWERGLVVGGH